MDKAKLQSWNEKIIQEFRQNDGQVTGDLAGAPLVLLHNKGAKSGEMRVNPLVYSKDGERFILIASYAGGPKNPDWYHNLVANPDAQLEFPRETFSVRARLAQNPERQRLFDAQAEGMPVFKDYEKKTEREIPVFILERV